MGCSLEVMVPSTLCRLPPCFLACTYYPSDVITLHSRLTIRRLFVVPLSASGDIRVRGEQSDGKILRTGRESLLVINSLSVQNAQLVLDHPPSHHHWARHPRLLRAISWRLCQRSFQMLPVSRAGTYAWSCALTKLNILRIAVSQFVAIMTIPF